MRFLKGANDYQRGGAVLGRRKWRMAKINGARTDNSTVIART